jgi:hypothetical protein
MDNRMNGKMEDACENTCVRKTMEVNVNLTCKRKRELKRLRRSAGELWEQQQEIWDRASAVAKEARRQMGHARREEIAPRMLRGYETVLRPGVTATGRLAQAAKERVVNDVIPSVGSAIGAAMSIADHAREARVRAMQGHSRAAVKKMSPCRAKQLKLSTDTRSGFVGHHTGAYLAAGVGVALAIGLGYSVWQTFRADDELWIADDGEDLTMVDE